MDAKKRADLIHSLWTMDIGNFNYKTLAAAARELEQMEGNERLQSRVDELTEMLAKCGSYVSLCGNLELFDEICTSINDTQGVK